MLARVLLALVFLQVVPAWAQDKMVPVLIGVAAPLSGDLASFGDQGRVGAETAAEDINKTGGILGRSVKLSIADDGCEGKLGVTVANRFIAEKVDMASHLCGPASLAASDVYKNENMIQMSAASSVVDYTGRGFPFVFRVYLGNDVQAKAAVEYLAKKQAGKTLALVYSRDAFGQGLTQLVHDGLVKAHGIKPAFYEPITEGQIDFKAMIMRFKQEKIDVVYLGAWPKDIGLFLRQAKELDYRPVFVTNDAAAMPEIWSIAGTASDGLIFTYAPDPRKLPGAEKIVQSIRKKNFEPAGVTLYAYAMIDVYRQAAEKAGSVIPDKVVNALKGNSFDTIIGTIRFDKNGNMTGLDYQMYVWRNGKYDYL